nr:hypothetical protein [Streptomyces sp. ODS05-4]
MLLTGYSLTLAVLAATFPGRELPLLPAALVGRGRSSGRPV